MAEIDTHGMVIDFGKHTGTLYTRVPVGYLFWMVNNGHSRKDIAAAEIVRRGSVMPRCDISGHAIDRASLNCWDIWRATCNREDPGEGFHAWLVRMTEEAILIGKTDDNGRYIYNRMKLVIENGEHWPVLKTVIRDKKQDTP